MNEIMVLRVFKYHNQWVFDDPARGLDKEPFVSGIDEIIDKVTERIPYASLGFNLLFSERPFPGFQLTLVKTRPEFGGTWYYCPEMEMEGWLCPALFKFFPEAPAHIYAQVRGVNHVL